MIHIPQTMNRTCFRCSGARAHLVAQVKTGKPSSLSQIKRRQARRGHRGNKGKFSKVPAKRVNTSRRPFLLLTCHTCGYKSNLSRPRCNKFQIRAV